MRPRQRDGEGVVNGPCKGFLAICSSCAARAESQVVGQFRVECAKLAAQVYNLLRDGLFTLFGVLSRISALLTRGRSTAPLLLVLRRRLARTEAWPGVICAGGKGERSSRSLPCGGGAALVRSGEGVCAPRTHQGGARRRVRAAWRH